MRTTTLTALAVCLASLPLSGPARAEAARPPVSFDERAVELAAVERHELPRLDNARLLAAAKARELAKIAAPFEFARAHDVGFGPDNAGTWDALADGSRLWRLRLASPSALHLNLGFSRFDLPAGAALWIYDPAGEQVEGPFTARHRSARGRLFTPIVRGDEVVVELHVPAAAKGALDLRLAAVNHGFRGFEKGLSGACNNDVVCPEGDPWRDQIRSVARYSIDGLFLCSGQLVNNTAQDDRPYFLSAFHCEVDANNADTLVFYWNYESPVCGQRGGGSLAQNQTGSIFRAGEEITDFVLVELSQPPPAAFDVFFTGWDVSGATPQSSVGIHHPAGDVKSISFNDDPLGTAGYIEPNTHWEVDDWEDGTTEGGSSGSCLWDPDTRLCVGTLTGGFASCSVIDFDIYGKLQMAWNAGGDAASRLRDWLDPLGLGVTTLAGKNPGDAPQGDCVPDATTLCLNNNRFQVDVDWTTTTGMGEAQVVPGGTGDSSNLWFFSPNNWEMLIKVLDGCAINDHYWVFFAATTDVEFTATVTDTETDTVQTYTNPLGQAANAVTDTGAFATCPAPSNVAVDRAVDAPALVAPALIEELASAALAARSVAPRPQLSNPRTPPRPRSLGDVKGLLDGASGLRLKACVDQQMSCNTSVSGVLTPDDCDLGDGTVYDYWEFAGSSGSTVTVDLTSSDFDTYLFLLDPAVEVVAQDDDGGGGTNSRIVFTLDAGGTWAIAVNNLFPDDLGGYTLTLACSGGPTSPPAAPTSLTATGIAIDTIRLGWQDNANNEDEFRVEYRPPGGGFTDLGAVGANSVGADVVALQPGTAYDFRVRARNAAGDSAYSNVASATTLEPGECIPDATTLCLGNDRFRVEVDWETASGMGQAQVVPGGTGDSSDLWFFSPNNWEMLIKVLDGCGINDRYWVFFAATTDVGFRVTVTDTQEGDVRVYTNPLGQAADAVTDTDAFATCP